MKPSLILWYVLSIGLHRISLGTRRKCCIEREARGSCACTNSYGVICVNIPVIRGDQVLRPVGTACTIMHLVLIPWYVLTAILKSGEQDFARDRKTRLHWSTLAHQLRWRCQSDGHTLSSHAHTTHTPHKRYLYLLLIDVLVGVRRYHMAAVHGHGYTVLGALACRFPVRYNQKGSLPQRASQEKSSSKKYTKSRVYLP